MKTKTNFILFCNTLLLLFGYYFLAAKSHSSSMKSWWNFTILVKFR